MTDRPLNPESVKAALCAFHGVPNDGSSWGVESCPIGAFNMTAAIRAYLAAEAERGWAMRPRVATADMMVAADTARNTASSVTAWRPIPAEVREGEAPWDGNVYPIGRHVQDWGFVRGYGYWTSIHGISGWVPIRGFSEVTGVLGLGNPTHYMPLPAPPEGE